MDFKQMIGGLRARLDNAEGVADEVFTTLDRLAEGVEAFSGIDPTEARTALQQRATQGRVESQLSQIQGERDQLAGQTETLRSQLAETQKELTAVRGLTAAGVREGYEDLILARAVNGLEVTDDGAIVVPDGYFDGFKSKYPEMFHAEDAVGSGGQVGGGNAPESGPRQVSVGSDRVIAGLDPSAVLNGDVVLTDS